MPGARRTAAPAIASSARPDSPQRSGAVYQVEGREERAPSEFGSATGDVEEPVAEVILVHGEDKRAAVMLLFVIR